VSRQPIASAERSRVRISGLVLLLGALFSVAVVAWVGIRFEDAESELAMEREQRRLANLASLLSVELAGELANLARDPPMTADPATVESGTWTTRVVDDGREVEVRVRIKELFHAADHLDSADERVFVQPPGSAKFFDLHGLSAGPGALAELVARGEETGMLTTRRRCSSGCRRTRRSPAWRRRTAACSGSGGSRWSGARTRRSSATGGACCG
jgi:hypothetical protein